MDKIKNLFDVTATTADCLELNQSYPFYGTITDIIEEDCGVITKFQINDTIVASVVLPKEDTKNFSDMIKSRVFDPGIFVCKYVGKTDKKILVDCQTIIFGKKFEEQVH